MTNLPPCATRHARFIVFGLLLALSFAACGKKGPVRPRLAVLPVAPAEVRIDQQGESFLLSWGIPAVNEDGSAAEDLAAFHIYRLVYNAAEGCPNCRELDERIETIRLNHPDPALRIGKRLYWRDETIAPGTGHVYLVVPVTIGGHEGGKGTSQRVYVTPPPAPLAVQAVAGERQVALSWTPPASLPDGQQLVGYNLYRRGPGEPFPPIALNPVPFADPRITDFAALPGHEAIYRLTTVTRSGEQLVESAPTADVAATPVGAR